MIAASLELYYPPKGITNVCQMDATVFVNGVTQIGVYLNVSLFSKNSGTVISTNQYITDANGNIRISINSSVADTITATISYTDIHGNYTSSKVIAVFH